MKVGQLHVPYLGIRMNPIPDHKDATLRTVQAPQCQQSQCDEDKFGCRQRVQAGTQAKE